MNLKQILGLTFSISTALISCAPSLGKIIETPAIPVVAPNSEARARLGSYISIQTVEDVRGEQQTQADDGFTKPFGDVTASVQDGLKNALRENGISILDSSPVALRAEIRNWRAKVDVKAGTTINSEATLFVELTDPSGKRLYSGTYNGTRASQFPVVTRIDVKDSLGLAMANAISQVVSDPQLLGIITSY